MVQSYVKNIGRTHSQDCFIVRELPMLPISSEIDGSNARGRIRQEIPSDDVVETMLRNEDTWSCVSRFAEVDIRTNK